MAAEIDKLEAQQKIMKIVTPLLEEIKHVFDTKGIEFTPAQVSSILQLYMSIFY